MIPDMQFGFREKHSTLHPLLKLQRDVSLTLNNHQVVVGCFLDIEKAFDSVWTQGLIHKLYQLGFPDSLVKIIHNFLHFRSFFVQLGNCQSPTRTIRAGVAQGSKLGPFLFNIFTSDQPRPVNPQTQTLLFADDSMTYAKSMSPAIAARRVEAHIRSLFEYYQQWGIKVNAAKSELVCFRRPVTSLRARSAFNCRNTTLTLPDGTQLRAKKNVKYLGIQFNEKFKFNPHATAVLRRANYAFHRIHPLMRKRNGLSQKTKLLLYKQLIRPIITYCFPIWFTLTKSYMNKLAAFERKILRICTDTVFDQVRKRYVSNKKLYEKANITTLDRYLIESSRRLLLNMDSHPNPLIGGLFSQPRHPDPRYLEAMALYDEDLINTNDEEDIRFYADPGSAYYRG